MGEPLRRVRTFRKYLGGSAGNTAVGLARLGASVGLISRVGPDEFGRYLLERLAEEGVVTSMVGVDPVYPTGLAFAALFPPGDSEVLFYRKPCADAHLCIEDLDLAQLRATRVLVVTCTALAVSPGREATLLALETVRSGGGINVLDIDWRPMFWASLEEARIYYRAALRLADVVLANEAELAFAGNARDPEEAARSILALGVREVVAKQGGSGCLYSGEGGPLAVSAFSVPVLNTLGAGDGFGAAYSFGLLQGWPVRQRLQFANAAGAIVVTRHSCSEAMPTREEVERLLARGTWDEASP